MAEHEADRRGLTWSEFNVFRSEWAAQLRALVEQVAANDRSQNLLVAKVEAMKEGLLADRDATRTAFTQERDDRERVVGDLKEKLDETKIALTAAQGLTTRRLDGHAKYIYMGIAVVATLQFVFLGLAATGILKLH